jgi:hypothetical protein
MRYLVIVIVFYANYFLKREYKAFEIRRQPIFIASVLTVFTIEKIPKETYDFFVVNTRAVYIV